jgi:hypothetical protein
MEYMQHASKLVDSVYYIPLETTSECLIAEITKLIFTDNFIYVWDYKVNKLYQFDVTGKFIRQIGQIGQGPDEYVRINSFDVNKKNGNISIRCEMKQSVLEYDYTGKLVQVKKIGMVANNFIYYKDNYLFYCSTFPNRDIFNKTFPEQYRLVNALDGKIYEQYLKWTYNDYLSTSIFASNEREGLYQFNENIMLVENATNTVYKIEHDTILPIYAVDFGEYNIPFDMFSPQASKAKLDELANVGTKVCRLTKFCETNDLIYIQYIAHHYKLFGFSIFLKKTEEMINMGPLWFNDMDNIAMPLIATVHDDLLIGYFYAFNFYKMVKYSNIEVSKHLVELGKTGNNDDNPIICVVKMKK